MLITRWQAPLVPEKSQILNLFQMEGMSPYEDQLPPSTEINDIRNPFDEVRMVASGELLLDVAGNRLLLRPGDKILIPSNTKHAKINQGNDSCVCICAQKV